MRKINIGLFIFASLLLVGAAQAAPGAEVPEPSVSPMMQEIQTILAQQDIALLALHKDLRVAPTEQDALRILRAISDEKQKSELGILRVQVRHARQVGDEDAAVRIEQAIKRILNPQPVKASPEALKERKARGAEGAGHE